MLIRYSLKRLFTQNVLELYSSIVLRILDVCNKEELDSKLSVTFSKNNNFDTNTFLSIVESEPVMNQRMKTILKGNSSHLKVNTNAGEYMLR